MFECRVLTEESLQKKHEHLFYPRPPTRSWRPVYHALPS